MLGPADADGPVGAFGALGARGFLGFFTAGGGGGAARYTSVLAASLRRWRAGSDVRPENKGMTFLPEPSGDAVRGITEPARSLGVIGLCDELATADGCVALADGGAIGPAVVTGGRGARGWDDAVLGPIGDAGGGTTDPACSLGLIGVCDELVIGDGCEAIPEGPVRGVADGAGGP